MWKVCVKDYRIIDKVKALSIFGWKLVKEPQKNGKLNVYLNC